MAGINKIRIGEEEYYITPEIGSGLQFGTDIENSHMIYINIGEAKSNIPSLPPTGLYIDHLGFQIDCGKFKAFLIALGFKTE